MIRFSKKITNFDTMNKKTIIGLGSLAVLGYGAACLLPATVARKGYTPDEIRNLTIVAHRGGAALEPENTLRSVARGIACGADMIEIDIHQTADGHIVVCHDPTVDRTTDGSGKIADMTLEQIRALRIVDAEGHTTDLRIPTLDEVLELVGGRTRLLVEIKRSRGAYPGMEQRMLESFDSHDAFGWVVVQSFNDDVLATVHALNPEVRLEKLFICKLRGLPLIFDGTLTHFDYDKYAHVASFNIFSPSATHAFIDEAHAHGKEVKLWTLDAPADAPHMPVDGIITDRPDLWQK